MKLQKSYPDAARVRFGIVATRFNKRIVHNLLSSCVEELIKQGGKTGDIEVVRVPGAFEMPLAARTMARSGRFEAVICLGAVIRGDTPHFEFISTEASRGIGQAALDTGVPIIFGMLTTDTVAQAIERADPAKFNRGGEAAKSAIEMATVMRMLKSREEPGAEVCSGACSTASQTGADAKRTNGGIKSQAKEKGMIRSGYPTILPTGELAGSKEIVLWP